MARLSSSRPRGTCFPKAVRLRGVERLETRTLLAALTNVGEYAIDHRQPTATDGAALVGEPRPAGDGTLQLAPTMAPLPSNAPNTPSNTPAVAPLPIDAPTVAPLPGNAPTVAPSPSNAPTVAPLPSNAPTIAPSPIDAPTVAAPPIDAPTVAPPPIDAPRIAAGPISAPTVAPSPIDAQTIVPPPSTKVDVERQPTTPETTSDPVVTDPAPPTAPDKDIGDGSTDDSDSDDGDDSNPDSDADKQAITSFDESSGKPEINPPTESDPSRKAQSAASRRHSRSMISLLSESGVALTPFGGDDAGQPSTERVKGEGQFDYFTARRGRSDATAPSLALEPLSIHTAHDTFMTFELLDPAEHSALVAEGDPEQTTTADPAMVASVNHADRNPQPGQQDPNPAGQVADAAIIASAGERVDVALQMVAAADEIFAEQLRPDSVAELGNLSLPVLAVSDRVVKAAAKTRAALDGSGTFVALREARFDLGIIAMASLILTSRWKASANHQLGVWQIHRSGPPRCPDRKTLPRS